MVRIDVLCREFHRLYGAEPRLFRAPGRVNIIGEHTDYSEGFVLPAAIGFSTVVAAAARDDRRIRVYSFNFMQSAEFCLDDPPMARRGIWLDYIEGISRVLESRGLSLRGCNLAFESDVPVGAGLSSSAALEISAGLALVSLAGLPIDPIALAMAGQKAEHEYVGTHCGIMDQYVAALGRKNHALLIDCRSLEAAAVPLNASDNVWVICDSRVKHELASSGYNTRRAECERGVEILRTVLPEIRALRDVSVEDLQRSSHLLPDPIDRRCRHVVTENARTLAAAASLEIGDLSEVGRLMAESHRSLRDDYGVSCAELDLLVDLANKVTGLIGARMTGGGFGGCTINLVRQEALERFKQTVSDGFQKAFGRVPSIYAVTPDDGANEIAG